jgi:hypothetical protein
MSGISDGTLSAPFYNLLAVFFAIANSGNDKGENKMGTAKSIVSFHKFIGE